MSLAERRTTLPVVLGCLLVIACAGIAGAQTVEDRVTTALVERGFENVAVESRPEAVTVWYENRIFRHELTGMGMAARIAAGILDAAAVLELVPQNRGVSVVAASAPASAWIAFIDGAMDARTFRALLIIDPARRRGGLPLAPRGILRRNPSTLRTDLELRPLFDFQLGNGTDPFDYTLRVAPEAVMSPFRGGLITLQGAIRIHDDFDPCGEEDPCGLPVEPERNTLSWGGWLPGNWLVAASGGLFPGDRWGFAGEVGRLFWGGQIEIWAGGDLSGKLQFLEDVVTYSDLDQWTAFLAATHRFRGLDIESTVTVGRFREEKGAIKVELARRIEEFEIGFFAAANFGSDLGTSPYGTDDSGETAAGVNLRFALPVRHYSKPARFRPTTVPEFPFTYRSTVDPVAIQVSFYDNLDRLRKRLYPTYIWNEVESLRSANRYLREGDGS